jgi:hypothetical protein
VKLALVAATLTSLLLTPGAGAARAVPAPWKNCTAVNHRYHHGIGRAGAHDKTSGDPVTNFKRSTALYNTAMKYNRGLDRDKDGVACESS